MTHEELRTEHFKRLNAYRASKEYQESPYCFQKIEGDLPNLLGNRWEIDEEIYWEFLEILPPLAYNKRGGFYMSEFCFDNITTLFTKANGKYYCEFARYNGREAA